MRVVFNFYETMKLQPRMIQFFIEVYFQIHRHWR